MARLIRRPPLERQTTGAFFGEDAVLVRVRTFRNERGIATTAETRTQVRVATNPINRKDARLGVLLQGGNRLEDYREFYTAFSLGVKQRDKIVYEDETYTIVETSDFGDHSESLGKRGDT